MPCRAGGQRPTAPTGKTMREHFRASHRFLFSPAVWRLRLVLWSGAVLVGLAAAAFAMGADLASGWFRAHAARIPWLPFLATPLGLMAVAWITRRWFQGAEGSGIPQAIAALSMADHRARARVLSLKLALGKMLLTMGGLAAGGSIGREGPTVHVGAAILFSVRGWARFPRHDLERGLILAGGAAGIAAAFNTPLAGILFAIEEMSRSFEERSNGTILISVILAGVTALALLGNYTYFGTTTAALPVQAWYAVLVCGVVGGLAGGLFSQALIHTTRWAAPWTARHPLAVAAACGLAIAGIGWLSGGTTFGTGYEEAKGLVTGHHATDPWFPFLKMLATIVTYLTGVPGGIFAPSLSAGAGIGAELAPLFPLAPAAAIVVLGMVGYFAGVVQTPITAFVIIMEMTNNQAILFPLMATAFLAYAVSKLVCPRPLYRELAKAFLARA